MMWRVLVKDAVRGGKAAEGITASGLHVVVVGLMIPRVMKGCVFEKMSSSSVRRSDR